MNHIPTTATAAQKLKRLAKTRSKFSKESLAVAQDAVARESGYRDWKHVTVCLATTAAAKGPRHISKAVSEFLAGQRQAVLAAHPEIAQTLARALVFAMDIKDAESVRPDNSPEIQEFDDATSFLAGDVWEAVLRHEDEEGMTQASAEEGEELQEFLDFIGNYRFFRYSGSDVPRNLDDAFAGPFREFFFPPTHVWLEGKFIHMSDVREVRVNGRVVYSTSGGDSTNPQHAVGAAAANAHGPRPEPDLIVARLDVRKLQPSLYEYVVSHAGQELFSDAGFGSIADALRDAAEVTGSIRGYEVAYAGLVTGTYGVEELASMADQVARRAVDVASSLGHV